jgi:hypothetical protein
LFSVSSILYLHRLHALIAKIEKAFDKFVALEIANQEETAMDEESAKIHAHGTPLQARYE